MDANTRLREIRVRLFGSNAGRLDDRPPLLDFGSLQRIECLGRLLLARNDLLTELGKPLADRRFGERTHGRGVEPGDDILRRTFGGKQRTPDGTVESGQPGLV